MIDLQKPNEWQRYDPETGLLFPWLVSSFLDELKTWDLSDKIVLEIGMGSSTLWWDKKSAMVAAFDMNKDWYFAVTEKMDLSRSMSFLPAEGKIVEGMQHVLPHCAFDIAIIDCEPVEWRDKCVQPVLSCLKSNSKLIIDNWDQPSVWVPNDKTRELLSPYPCKIYSQEGHADWKTAVFDVI